MDQKHIHWDIFGNEMGVRSALGVIIGSVVGIVEVFPKWEALYVTLLLGLILLLYEYSRMKERKRQDCEKSSSCCKVQIPCTVAKCNYYVKCCIYICFGVPCCFLLPTLIGGLCLVVTAFIYSVAAIYERKNASVTIVKLQEEDEEEEHPGSSLVGAFEEVDFSNMRETVC